MTRKGKGSFAAVCGAQILCAVNSHSSQFPPPSPLACEWRIQRSQGCGSALGLMGFVIAGPIHACPAARALNCTTPTARRRWDGFGKSFLAGAPVDQAPVGTNINSRLLKPAFPQPFLNFVQVAIIVARYCGDA